MSSERRGVVAIVVTYNRKKLLIECLDALLNQTYPLDSIIIVDNASTDGTPELLEQSGYRANPLIDYVRLSENTGGAGGFYHGMKRGYDRGFDWLWIMDDDAEPLRESLSILIENIGFIKDKNLGALAQAVVDQDGEICLPCRGNRSHDKIIKYRETGHTPLGYHLYKNPEPLQIDFASFVGLMISRNVVREVGFPNNKFFIYLDDVEYSLRIRKVANIYLIPRSVILHKYAVKDDTIPKKFLWLKSNRVHLRKFIFIGFKYRNMIYMVSKYKLSSLLYYYYLLIDLLKTSVEVIVFDDHKATRLGILWKAVLDGLFGRFDNSFVK